LWPQFRDIASPIDMKTTTILTVLCVDATLGFLRYGRSKD
jgi:hypothetical protein